MSLPSPPSWVLAGAAGFLLLTLAYTVAWAGPAFLDEYVVLVAGALCAFVGVLVALQRTDREWSGRE